jgi:hypothetical protein
MNETYTNSKTQKEKTSKWARYSCFCGVFGLLVLVVSVLMATIMGMLQKDASIVMWLFPVSIILSIIALTSGILGLIHIQLKRRRIKGTSKAIIGILCSLLALAIVLIFILPAFRMVQPVARRIRCAENLARLGKEMRVYSNDNDSRYPTADRWCDLLLQYTHVTKKHFVCKGALVRGGQGPCHYAINPNAEPNSPNDVVLLFETKGGWNQFGGPEILTYENHMGEGCNTLFNDGKVEFVVRAKYYERKKWIGELKWKVEESE